ncbi:lysophospholipid acyltransferase 1 isoform X1 [Patagioenas fasciata]|uniref:lysophospholipid acyltransferase 1 isoform X1 n=1 Tax=Patagioenas fasciata TaxID=372321 RepID=UPI003A98EEB0
MQHGRAARRPAPHHRLHLATPAERAAGHPAGPDQFCSLSTVCTFGCVLVSYLLGSQSCQLCCSPCICHPLWNILCCLLLWVVFHSSFCPGDDELWHYEYGKYSQHPQVLLCCSYGIPHIVPHKPNIHISLWYSHYRFFRVSESASPLMIITQKITTLACQLHDGIGRQAEELTAEQNRLAVKTRPSLLEYLSYLLNFMSIIAGPCSNYKDYIAFIEGRHVHMKLLEVNWKQKGYDRLPDPSPTGAVMYKLCITLVSLILFLTLTKNFPMAYIIDNEFLDKTPFLSRLGYLYVVTQAAKPKYYFAWTLADAVNNAAGYGFSGVDEKGIFRWDLLSNLNIWNIETATSFKMYIENWNIQTAAWLKRVCYDRAPWYPTALTFILSALWHGIYPGYYFTFLTGILITLAARAVRNNCRHYFLSSVPLKIAYDVATWVVTQLAVCYTVAPFVMLAVEPTIKFYKSMYFHMHILSILVLLVLPIRPQTHSMRKPQNQAMKNAIKSKDK